ncbi:MAG TPA: lipocalin-like domain-containing protein [Blastocatellia bacterium]|nr:lipocalin-like domain-containing protein [Blastocatellia bacterium]HMX27046.1 lipocalin-like domain-containing protein [Blastocatellia bacterium]HMZ20064.1 lipocalin-like domain-containing protein [Blastocatellia bacterium]HNG33101.1 lipocalin-like domain-containing protein [Blastocatellia bacterium]
MKEQFVGTWRLVEYEYLRSNGEQLWPFGQSPVGVIIYTAEGFMSVQIMDSERPAFVGGNRWSATLAEMAAAFQSYLAYFGGYEVCDEEGCVIHHIEGSLFPEYTGSAQKRYFEFEGNRLTLRTPPLPAGKETITGRLVWERATA